MSQNRGLPLRPRLAEHAVLRHRLLAGLEHFVVHDITTDEVLEVSARTVEIIRCADGTRDLGGVLLAAVRRGVYRNATEVEAVLAELMERRLLADGLELGDPPRSPTPERPLEVLDDFTLHCDSNGTCCCTHSAVAFRQAEMERARMMVPEREEANLSFLPLIGSIERGVLAPTMIDGRCPYLEPDGRCQLHRLGGPEAKPLGCRLFPATFVDDGEAIRVSVMVECPCVLQSVGKPGGEPLVPPGAVVEGDLEQAIRITRLPEQIKLGPERSAPRAALRQWSQALSPLLADVDDPLAALWTLAEVVKEHGLAPEAAVAALPRASAPSAMALGLPAMHLVQRAQRKEQAQLESGAEQTPAGRLSRWLAREAGALLTGHDAAQDLLGPRPEVLPRERFYLGATLFGHHLVSEGQPLESALRDRALRLLLARRLGRERPDDCAELTAAAFPIVVVEALMRGQGLETYVTSELTPDPPTP